MRCPAPLSLMATTHATLNFSAAASGQFNTPNPGGGGATGTGRDPSEVIFWCIVLLAVAFVMGLAFWIIRKKLVAGDNSADVGGFSLGFTLADLRQMHAEGQMTDEEFEYAKRKMAAKAKAQIEGTDPDEPHPPGNGPGRDEPVIEDLGDISDPGPHGTDSFTTDPPTDPDKHDDPKDDFGDDPDKIDGP